LDILLFIENKRKEPVLKLILGSDHRGFILKTALLAHWPQVLDQGCDSPERVDYPLIAHRVVHSILKNPGSFGVLICGTGIGMSIAANRYAGIRAALCCNAHSVHGARTHNDANIICLSESCSLDQAISWINQFIQTPFEGGAAHVRRLHQIEVLKSSFEV
jgi:ribose 5-phosphate isomerase B